MKVTTERLPKSLIAVDIELDPQQVNKGLDKAARQLSQQYRIPGFRPGKAPRFIVENYLGRDRILEEATDDLMNSALKEALKSENIAPVGQVSLDNFERDPFRFRVLVPVEPSVVLPDYAAYSFPLDEEAVSDESVQKLLDAQREQHVVLQSLETPRAAQEGDLVTVKISSDLDEEDEDEEDEEDNDAIVAEDEDDDDDDEDEDDEEDDDEEDDEDDEEDDDEEDDDEDDDDDEEDDEEDHEEGDDEEGEDDTTDIALVPGRVQPEFLEALVGAEIGDKRTVTISYAEDDSREELRGKTVTYELVVEKVQQRILPEWDELPTLTQFDGDLDAMRANARKRLEHAASEKARRSVLDSFMERALSDAEIDVPDALVTERATELFHEQVSQFTRYGLTEEQLLSSMGKSHEEAVAGFAEQAERDVRVQYVLREIIKREGLSLEPSEVEAETERFLEDYEPGRRSEIRPMLDAPRMQQMIASSALDRKLRDRIVDLTTGKAADVQTADEGTSPADDNITDTTPATSATTKLEPSSEGEASGV